MVSKKRLEYGLDGLRAPIVPRAPRSNRRRGPRRNTVGDGKLCAFELLADVAGKLLKESEGSSCSNVAEGKVHRGISLIETDKGRPADGDKALKSESYDHGSCAESAFIPDISVGVCASVHECSGFMKKVDSDVKLGVAEGKSTGGAGDHFKHNVETEPVAQSEDDKNHIGELSMASTSTVKEPAGEHVNTNLLINSENSVQLPLYRDHNPGAFLQKHRNNVKLGIRDDDEKYFGCNKFSTKIRAFRPQPRIGHRRIRNTLASKYWKAAPKRKDYDLYKTGDGMKAFHRYRSNFYARERFQQVPIKKRKLSDHSFAVAYDQNTSNGSISRSPEKGKRGDKSGSTVILHRASGAPATMQSHQKTKNRHVKFSIKSFRVPELYVEVPEAATVGSLKRTVMDAVTTILGDGIRVGVVLQGKKVRDDSRTLQQAGISQSSILDTLGFTLEPSFKLSPSSTPKKPPLILPCDADQQLPRSSSTLVIDSGISNASVDPPVVTNSDKNVDFIEYVPSSNTLTESPIDGAVVPESKAIVPISPIKLEALAVVPMNSKPKRNDLSQRRIRRPFSVGEVEALVEAVEKLGTGRWRDVKMRAFESADHRTYVDLKDKWKTLVHTATISPQQRRGEPVPQELLDRVLSVHSFWLQNQPKLQGKNPVEPLKIVDALKDIEGSDLLTVNL